MVKFQPQAKLLQSVHILCYFGAKMKPPHWPGSVDRRKLQPRLNSHSRYLLSFPTGGAGVRLTGVNCLLFEVVYNGSNKSTSCTLINKLQYVRTWLWTHTISWSLDSRAFCSHSNMWSLCTSYNNVGHIRLFPGHR
jgi:hypothetical protein